MHIHSSTQLTMRETADKLGVTFIAASHQVSKLGEENYLKRETNVRKRWEILVGLDRKGTDYI